MHNYDPCCDLLSYARARCNGKNRASSLVGNLLNPDVLSLQRAGRHVVSVPWLHRRMAIVFALRNIGRPDLLEFASRCVPDEAFFLDIGLSKK